MRERMGKVNIRGQALTNMYLEIDQDQERSREIKPGSGTSKCI